MLCALLTAVFLLLSLVSCQGVVSFYFDNSCVDVSGTFSLTLGLCANAMGAGSVSIQTLPSCENGIAPVLYLSDNAGCATPNETPYISSGTVGQCLYLPSGFPIASVDFYCSSDGGATSSLVTSTTIFGLNQGASSSGVPAFVSSTTQPQSPVAASSTSSSGASSQSSPTSITDNSFTSSPSPASSTNLQTTLSTTTTTPLPEFSASPTSSPVSSTNPSSNPTPNTSNGGLSESDKITLGTSIGFGIPTVGLALWGLIWGLKNRKKIIKIFETKIFHIHVNGAGSQETKS